MRVALTGTPGVGKTTLSKVAAADGWSVLDLKAWAAQEGCVVGWDEEDQAEVVDVKRLAKRVRPDDGSKLLVEGHLSHLLPLDAAWVVRADPKTLATRLEARGYPDRKVRENMEAEALDIILQEALERHPARLVQRDGTRRSPQELYKSFADVRLESLKRPDLEPVDWTDRL